MLIENRTLSSITVYEHQCRHSFVIEHIVVYKLEELSYPSNPPEQFLCEIMDLNTVDKSQFSIETQMETILKKLENHRVEENK